MSEWFLSYILIKVIHEFDSRLSCGNLKGRSKFAEPFCKRTQTYWQSSSYREWLAVDVNLTQKETGIF